MVLLPLYLLLIKLHLINSYIALLLLYAGTVLPSCLWQFRFYYDTIPIAVEEAAAIDGCSRWQTFYRVVLPGAKPVFFATAVFSFIMAWNEYLLGAVLVEDTDLFTLPLGLNLVQANTNLQPGLYAAGALIACVPLIALFLCLSRYAVSVFSSITLKGYTNQ
jgi:arabinogalactan oligomer/maltooligosaccharide transport system permease protein